MCDQGTQLTPRDAPPCDPSNISAGAPYMLIGMSEFWRPTPNIQIWAERELCGHARVGVQNGGSRTMAAVSDCDAV
jgi:hypothetical protein